MPEKERKFTPDDLKQILDAGKEAGREDAKVREIVERARLSLEQGLNNRSKELGPSLKFEIKSPEIPEGLTKEHIEALEEIFGAGNLEPMVIPKPEELHNLNKEYANLMYPVKDEKRQEQDKTNHNGLVSFRPDWFNNKAEIANFDFQDETWGQAYLRSMQEQLKEIGGSIIFVETLQKPEFIDKGVQHYGTKQGTDSSKDSMLYIFQQAFSQDSNRFNHSPDELQETLLSKLKEVILNKLKEKRIQIPDNLEIEPILVPAPLLNIQMTLFHPENSQTNTWECTSTILTDINGNDSGLRLNVGHSGNGGASDVYNARRRAPWEFRGARLAVVLRKHTKI